MGNNNIINPKAKDILRFIATGALVSTLILAPGIAVGAGIITKIYEDEKSKKQKREYIKYNLPRLRQLIKRLQNQKMIAIDGNKISITNKGRKRIMQYELNEMRLREAHDGKWRIVIYDIEEFERHERRLFRKMLRQLKFLKIQKSVYLTPFPCENEIEYLRQRFHVGSSVNLIVATGLENSQAYKEYFGI